MITVSENCVLFLETKRAVEQNYDKVRATLNVADSDETIIYKWILTEKMEKLVLVLS